MVGSGLYKPQPNDKFYAYDERTGKLHRYHRREGKPFKAKNCWPNEITARDCEGTEYAFLTNTFEFLPANVQSR